QLHHDPQRPVQLAAEAHLRDHSGGCRRAHLARQVGLREINDHPIGVLEGEEFVRRALGQIEGELRRIRARGELNATKLRGAAKGNSAQTEQTGSESFAKGLSNHWVRSASCRIIYGVSVFFSTAAYSLSAAAVPLPAQPGEPGLPERRARTHLDVMARRAGCKRQGQIRRRQTCP